jgi:hypothetical protein
MSELWNTEKKAINAKWKHPLFWCQQTSMSDEQKCIGEGRGCRKLFERPPFFLIDRQNQINKSN